jgi:hypothetical protein
LPLVITREYLDWTFTFQHYALDPSGKDFKTVQRNRTPEIMDELFEENPGTVACYGHDHCFSDISGQRRYMNPGSLGCNGKPIAEFIVVDISTEGLNVHHEELPYDPTPLRDAFADRQVPDRKHILAGFFGFL